MGGSVDRFENGKILRDVVPPKKNKYQFAFDNKNDLRPTAFTYPSKMQKKLRYPS